MSDQGVCLVWYADSLQAVCRTIKAAWGTATALADKNGLSMEYMHVDFEPWTEI